MKEEIDNLALATLAASLPTGNARERVALAYEIWSAAYDVERVAAAYYEGLHRTMFAAQDNLYKAIPPIPLSKALEQILPTDHRVTREDKWERFRAWQAATDPSAATIEDDRRIGVLFHPSIYDQVKEFEEVERKATLQDRARKGGIAKKAKADAEKNPSVKTLQNKGKTAERTKRTKNS